ncbi:MAG TPA: flagellar biosynthesis anti-sigma factor FlgM [Geobacteraceae bacterium]|nr:flagellar biosynthesis anti-sigma factor FlgM [Geobacteraceae bacterium]
MRIDNVSVNNVISAYQSDPLSRAKGDAGQQTDKAQNGQSDQVELSTRKSDIEKLKKAAEALPDMRHDKVAALKQQISDGNYRVDGVTVAEKMTEDFKGSGGKGGIR